MNSDSKSLQWIVWGGMALTIAGITLAFIVGKGRGGKDTPGSVETPDFSANADGHLPVLFEVTDFALTNQNGQVVTRADLRGKIWIADIIFTLCGGPCPDMTRRMAELQTALSAVGPLRFVTLTTHPEHDTPPVLQAYARRFGAQSGRWHFLTGTKKQIIDLAIHGLKFTALEKETEKQENPNDLFIHSTVFVLIDRQGRARAVFESDQVDSRQQVVKAVDQLLHEWTLYDLPAVNASLNALASILLTAGFIFIKRGNRSAHRNCMIGALTASVIFLGCYLYYHFHAGRTVFTDPAWFRPIYLTLLLTHTVLAVTIVPMIFITVSRAAKARFELHKKIARWTWPIWMYVSVTGVLIYFLLYQIFPQR